MTEETKIKTKNNSGLMGLISLILGLGGAFLSYYFIYLFLVNILTAETKAARECRLTAPFFIPAFACIGILGGILWLVASVGFFQKKKWAYSVGVVAVVIALFASFWPNIPAMESKAAVPGPWFLIFFPNLLVYFYLLRSKGKESWSKAWLGLGVGMAFILLSINGIAATTRMVNRLPNYGEASMFMLTMPTNFIASFLFGITVVGLFLSKKKELVRIVGLAGVFMALIAGLPLAIYSTFYFGDKVEFSMFFMGPIVSLLVGFVFVFQTLWKKVMSITE
jgi:hypothetical protein